MLWTAFRQNQAMLQAIISAKQAEIHLVCYNHTRQDGFSHCKPGPRRACHPVLKVILNRVHAMPKFSLARSAPTTR